jgi:hypothetical protein
MAEEKVSLRTVLFDKMNAIECAFQRQEHLDPKFIPMIEDQIAWISKMWRVVSDEDKEWIEMAQYAMEEKRPWV